MRTVGTLFAVIILKLDLSGWGEHPKLAGLEAGVKHSLPASFYFLPHSTLPFLSLPC